MPRQITLLETVQSAPIRDAHDRSERFRRIFTHEKQSESLDTAINLLEKLLIFDPRNGRISAVEALEHKYVSQFHDPAAETVAKKVVELDLDDYDKKSTNFYRQELYEKWHRGGGNSRR